VALGGTSWGAPSAQNEVGLRGEQGNGDGEQFLIDYPQGGGGGGGGGGVVGGGGGGRGGGGGGGGVQGLTFLYY